MKSVSRQHYVTTTGNFFSESSGKSHLALTNTEVPENQTNMVASHLSVNVNKPKCNG